ncbi:putative ABC transporter permease [Parvularcula bermudensis HTCC2503]|uniref:Putative ABC transporter permease n=1 Tax=Parvularcula bermudensis (strain ATCC BAA-594 / HTCC2503 / KCTC 12087) TaxID=314260 RepID=E0THW9_PARBH|nr:DUF3526 domain-containing protein [Parvularcula bermudensis]ADM10780.1 putative ABC transporter permease [Parvularcula bermudensis HTCC2503]
MNTVLTIAADEWRYWRRSHLALAGFVLFAVLIVATSIITTSRIAEDRHVRDHQQEQAEETFLAQPDRHPHRMVHYGHYVFRTPVPLAIFDPGVDPVTGQSIFLEGHRQNSAMFAETRASADLGGMALLTPAFVYQVIAPLLVILLGHSAIVRERESRTLAPLLAQGVGGRTLLAGKLVALVGAIVLLLVPLFVVSGMALAAGEVFLSVVSIALSYFVYLVLWGLMTLVASTALRRRASVLAGLSAVWIAVTLLVPAIGVSAAAYIAPVPGKIETDLDILEALREVGDGHNANDPAFARLRDDLLEQYDVETVEELPINFRGIVAQYAEGELTRVLNEYAEGRMEAELEQSHVLSRFGWASPMLALGAASRAIAGTDLEMHHRFLREAEQLRFDFVQSLNEVHAEQLTYADDINRSSDTEAERRTRVSSENWSVLDEFEFTAAPASVRLSHAGSPLIMLIVWSGLMLALSLHLSRKLQPLASHRLSLGKQPSCCGTGR